MGRGADQFLRAEKCSGGADRKRRFTQLHACGVNGKGDVNAIVDQQQRIVAVAQLARLLSEVEQRFAAKILFPKLDCFDAALQRLLQHREQISSPCLGPICDKIKIKIGCRHLC